ncbi:uncharacterized protein [Venturia canescens]|uniref:uncharacterized protein n=1 Tax=Venturia canescens TaxID=32260 RepID=UPI001C9C3C86|nr:uncharacterized protein LOC122412364 [Venturia canescens]
MYLRNYGIVSALVGLCLSGVLSQTSQVFIKLNFHIYLFRAVCDLQKCPGPLYYYEEIGCTPVFENVTSCCPSSYNCDIWKNRTSHYHCLADGRVYNHNQVVPTEDACSFCRCRSGNVRCMETSCSRPYAEDILSCRHLLSNVECCKIYHVCENSPDVCNVDGKSYKAGETFVPINEPEKTCTCDEGYDGVNDERFCQWSKRSRCPNDIANFENIHNGCAPIYERESMLYNACSKAHVCPEEGKYAIDKKSNIGASTLSTSEAVVSVQQCRIGNVTLNIGDKLRYEGRNVKCICEVPPIPTCYETSNCLQRLKRVHIFSNEGTSTMLNHNGFKIVLGLCLCFAFVVGDSTEQLCTYGHFVMSVGVEMKSSTLCTKCICEVPPVPKCQELPKEEC